MRPTIFPSVPRLYNRIYGTINGKINKQFYPVKKLMQYAIRTKLKNLKNGQGMKHGLFDKFLFSAIRKTLGGRIRVMCTGSAPIAGDVLDFLKICFSAPICEGYGMTESCAASVLTFPDDP